MEEGQRRRRKEWKEIRKLMERVGYSENICERLSQFVCLSVCLSLVSSLLSPLWTSSLCLPSIGSDSCFNSSILRPENENEKEVEVDRESER